MSDINKDYTPLNPLTPFKLCVLENFPFIETDFDAVTNYQLLCKVVEYLNNVIDNNNKQNTNINQLEDNFNTLSDYTMNYFNNLDVQSEVNKKLDEMAASGELTNIFSQYLNSKSKYIFSNILKSGGSLRIVGDSIGMGYDVTGTGTDSSQPVIFNYGGLVNYQAYTNPPSWVNRLRLMLNQYNQNIRVINASVNGRSAKEAASIKSGYKLTDEQHDNLILLALGTNDLHMCSNESEFINSYSELIKYFKTISDNVLCLTIPPVLRENSYTQTTDGSSVNLKTYNINRLIYQCAIENSCDVIDINNYILSAFMHGYIKPDDFFKDDVLHPSELGHTLYFNFLCEMIGVKLNNDLYESLPAIKHNINLENGWNPAVIDNNITGQVESINSKTAHLYACIKDGTSTFTTVLFTFNTVFAPLTNTMVIGTYRDKSYNVKPCLLELKPTGECVLYENIEVSDYLIVDVIYTCNPV